MHYTELHFEDAVRPEKLAELVNQLKQIFLSYIPVSCFYVYKDLA